MLSEQEKAEIRFKCLQLALNNGCGSNPTQTIEAADTFYNFTLGTNSAENIRAAHDALDKIINP